MLHTARALKHTIGYDIEKRNFVGSGTLVAPITSALGMSLLSGERPNGYEGWFTLVGVFFSAGKIFSAHPAIFLPLALGSSLANICLRRDDERRRLAGQSVNMHDYNGLMLGFGIGKGLNPRQMLDTGRAIINTRITGNRLKDGVLTFVGFAALGCFYYTAMPVVLSHMLPYVGYGLNQVLPQPIVSLASTLLANYFKSLAIINPATGLAEKAVDWAKFSNFMARNIIWPLIPAIVSYFNRACDIYNGHTAYEAVRTTVGAANMAQVPVVITAQVEEAIAAISQRSGKMEQLLATAIVLHDSKIDLMAGNGAHGKRNLFQGANGFCQAVANRGGALAGVAAGAINNITNIDVVGVLVSQNNKDVIRDNKGNINDQQLRQLVTTMAGLTHARPGCANIVNIEETVKLVKFACQATERGR